jgi:plastocyanin
MNKLNSKLLLLLLITIGGMIGFFGVRAIGQSSKNLSAVDCKGTCVYLQKNGMQPNELAIKVGEYVQFNSADGKKHNLAEGDGAQNHAGNHDTDHHDHVGGLVSGEFGADEAWRVQFKKTGTYRLHDHYNPHQTILIVVY